MQVKAEKSSRNLGRLQECSRNVNEMAANVVASTKSGQEQIEEKGEVFARKGEEKKPQIPFWPGRHPEVPVWLRFGTCGSSARGVLSEDPPLFSTDTMDFSGMSLIKLKKEEMETQVRP